MHIVFDMDNTLADELGKAARPGILELLEKLKEDGHTLSIWTNSTRIRALIILKDLGLRKYFTKLVFREDYDPENKGIGKDLRTIDGDCLIDDDPREIAFTKSIGKRAFLIKPFRGGSSASQKELKDLYKYINRANGILGSLFR